MKLLLDTHIFLWWDNDPRQLSATAYAALMDDSNTLVVSVASVWEIQIKVQLGKLQLRAPLADVISQQTLSNGIEVLPTTVAHVLALESLPMHHKDPFDRILIAQAISESMVLLTADPALGQYPVQVLG